VVDHEDLLVIQNYWQTGDKYTPTPTPTITETPTITQTPTQTPKLGTYTLQLADDATMEFCEIPSGSFQMGIPTGGSGWNFCFEVSTSAGCAWPLHDVTFDYSFYMGKTEVTRAQWYAVMGSLPDEIAEEGPDTRPISYISWADAQDFISMLNNLGQGTFRLPSEAEWEYACRAGTRTRFYFGNSDCDPKCYFAECPCQLDDYAWWGGLEGQFYGPEPVSQKLPNAWGLRDMHGNVRELCQDDWHHGYTGAPLDGSAWVDGQEWPVVKGGSFLDDPIECQSAFRSFTFRNQRYDLIGLRVVREKD
jgi:formylglycine-generating enzyme required for sulfatase activity